MKTLFLIRHAKSSWDDPELPDKDRPLGDRGRRDARKMGKRLAKGDVNPRFDPVQSGAARALESREMICRQCGTEIADKALVCYRCGTATAEAKFKPVVPPRAARRTVLIVVLIAIVLIALTTAYVEFSRGAQTGAVSGIAVAAALLIVVVRAVARRR